jgi:uncharacterized protein (DUF58 family)
MVPRPRLIFIALIAGVPLLGVAVGRPDWLAFATAALALVAAIAGWDAWRGRSLLDGIDVVMPPRLQWVQGRASELAFGFQTAVHRRPFLLRAAFAMPPELELDRDELEVVLPAEAGRHELACSCLPRRRGLFQIEGCYYETTSPLGLWDVRGHSAKSVEVRVYPNMEKERKQVASLFLRTRHSGAMLTRQVGQGRDFEKLREYVPGDGYSTIHWKASARRRHPITKTFQVEKTQEVYVILDASRLSARLQVPGDAAQGTHLDRYIAAALVLGLAAEKQGDLFGLVTFSDRVLSFVRARNGKEHYGACREALYRLEPQAVSPDYEELATFIRLRLRRRALLIFMTDLDDPVLMETFQHAVNLICRKHLILVQMLQPGNIRPLFTRETVSQVDEIYQDLAHHFAWSDLRQLTLDLRQRGVALSLLAPDQFSAEATSSYLRVKQRQLL